MRVGILGSGLMGGKLGTIFARAGHEVVFSYARSEQKLKTLAREAEGNATHGTPREAAQDADAVLLAVHWSRVDDVLKKAGDLSGKMVVTCSLPMNADDTEARHRPHVIGRGGTPEENAEGARRVPRSIRCPAKCCLACYESKRKARRPSLVYCGDDQAGKGRRRRTHSRHGLRARRRGPAAHRAIYRAVRAPHRRIGVRGRQRAGIGVSIRALYAPGLKQPKHRRLWRARAFIHCASVPLHPAQPPDRRQPANFDAARRAGRRQAGPPKAGSSPR